MERYKIFPKGYTSPATLPNGRKPPPVCTALKTTRRLLHEHDPVGWSPECNEWWEKFIHDAESYGIEAPPGDVRDEYFPLIQCPRWTMPLIGPVLQVPLAETGAVTAQEMQLVEPEYLALTTTQASSSTRKRRSADLQDLNEGDMIAMTPTSSQQHIANEERESDVVTPFWICEVVTVGDGSALTVAWYGADVHKDRANDKDDWGRFRFTKRFQAHNKTRPVTSTVNKYACGILAYGFVLKKQVPTGGVPMRVIALIKERLTTTTNDVDLDEELE